MKITVLTCAPEMFESLMKDHVLDRAVSLGCLEIHIIDIRDYSGGCFRKVDDSPYGGGAGLILRCQPVLDALADAVKDAPGHAAVLVPGGRTFDQSVAEEYASLDHLVLICGHYEGMDERILEEAGELLSVGDFVLSGGEIAAMTVMDCVARLLPGVLKNESLREESFSSGLLEYPQYTRPAEYKGKRVPEVLLSGNHEAIRRWREAAALEKTKKYRPDLL